jgi:ribulose-5-phosphate 4-epimerase/fuculose-1-phosphate aldolase
MGQYDKFKHEVLDSTRWLSEQGYFGKISSGGNVSVRMAEQRIAVITPSGKPYLQLTEGDVCVIDFDRNSIEGPLPPSIEAGMHIGVYY